MTQLGLGHYWLFLVIGFLLLVVGAVFAIYVIALRFVKREK